MIEINTNKYLLISSDGYSIETTRYPDKKSATAAMHKAYDELNQNTPGDEWDSDSYCNDEDALLYNAGENVYVWTIEKI